MKIATWINAHKILVTPAVLAMVWAYGNWSTEAFVYLALHLFLVFVPLCAFDGYRARTGLLFPLGR